MDRHLRVHRSDYSTVPHAFVYYRLDRAAAPAVADFVWAKRRGPRALWIVGRTLSQLTTNAPIHVGAARGAGGTRRERRRLLDDCRVLPPALSRWYIPIVICDGAAARKSQRPLSAPLQESTREQLWNKPQRKLLSSIQFKLLKQRDCSLNFEGLSSLV